MANGQYHGTIPNIAQAYQNDPRTKLAANALMQGTSTQPVAGGAWAWADGLSRIGQAFLGRHMNQKQEEKYSEREQAYMAAMQDAAKMASAQNPAQANPAAANPSGYDAAAGALQGRVGVPQAGAVQPVDLPPSVPAQAPQGAPMLPPQGGPPPASAVPTQRPPVAPPFPMVEGGSAPFPDPTAGGTGPSRGAPVNPSVLFRKGIVPIEGGTDKNGRFLTSPKGAYGPSQLMPGTAPEAMELAGFRRDDPRWRTDAEINLKAGEAYYAKQLQTFGDPVKAAAAYNAGPGNVRKALRRARRTGSDWTEHLPDETKKYVVNFSNAVGGDAGGDPAAMQASVPPAQMEQVPNAPQAPGERPQAPQLPEQVQTNRIQMAQNMLQSGNPDLVSIAQTYLDKGLDEQQQARTVANQQQFQQGQTGFQADLNDWGQARGDARNFGYNQVRDAQQRNFQRGEREAGQQYQSGERALDRAYGTSERLGTQEFQAGQNNLDRDWRTQERLGTQEFTAGQNELERGNKLDIAAQRRQQFFSTPSGAKLQKETMDALNTNTQLIADYERFMEINRNKATGGAAMNTPVIGSMYNALDSDLQEMTAIANDTTFNKIGGLGTAISDGDRKFVESANVSTATRGRANTNIAKARIGVLKRHNDYLTNYAYAQADGSQREFMREWTSFVKAVPIVVNGRATDRPMTFEEWKASRPKYGADGKRIN